MKSGNPKDPKGGASQSKVFTIRAKNKIQQPPRHNWQTKSRIAAPRIPARIGVAAPQLRARTRSHEKRFGPTSTLGPPSKLKRGKWEALCYFDAPR